MPETDEQPELPLFDTPAPEPAEAEPAPDPASESAPGRTSRTFLGWDAPVLESVTAHLAAGRDEGGALDLSDLLVIVPTRHAGRRLRESLALRAARRDAAVIPPLVVTQDFLVASDRVPDGPPVADRQATRLVWAALLLEIDLGRFRCAFPVDPVERHLGWAMKTADELLAVRNLLAESGLTFAAASDPLRERDMEPLRWKELAELESLAIRRARDLGLRDETLARLDAARSGELPGGITRILAAATPDLRPLGVAALERAAARLPVEVLVHAPASEADRFDAWGRPVPERWLEAGIDIPDPAGAIHDAATPADQAELACELLGRRLGELGNPAAVAAVGVPDPEVIDCLEQSAIRRGWSTHDPAGRPVSNHGIYYLLDQTASLVATRSFEAVPRLLRCPDFGKALVSKLPVPDGEDGEPRPVSTTAFLARVDELRERCLPDQLEDALAAAKRNFPHRPELAAGLGWIADWMRRFRREDFGAVLVDYLSEIFADRTFTPQETAHGAFSETAAAVLEAEAAFATTRSAFPRGGKLQPSERFHLLLELIREKKLHQEREPEDLDLEGWLELLWEDAPHLVVTGMNDHVVPEAIIGHAFLPDSARRALGIPDNDDRFARDAYLLTALVESRRESGERPDAGRPCAGRIDLVFGRQSEGGDPLRPSRLLFQCPDEELPERTLQFFGGETPASRPLPWTLPWKLQPRPLPDDAKIFRQLSVTQFRGYLTCPFRFYLQHGLRMEEIDPEKSEMDARDFGNLLHDALERFARDPEAAASTEPRVIRAALEREVDAILGQRYGAQLSTPVLIQREAARRRLAWWSEIEAAQRAGGWRILETETPLSPEDTPFTLAGQPISGRIDRIEEHEDGRLRVFDFKTHSIYDSTKYRNKRVDEYHLAPIKRTEDPESFPGWARVENGEGKAARWVDLQIPLYRLALAERFPGREIEAGHIALGPTEAEVVLDPWSGLDEALLESARACAEGVIEAVRGRVFWPPAERLPWSDPFEELLFGEAGESVDAAGLEG